MAGYEFDVSLEPRCIDIKSARFTDLLNPDQEAGWDEFEHSIDETQVYFMGTRSQNPEDKAEPLFEIYSDPSTPQVFRDRAMVLAFNDRQIKEGERFQDYTEGSPEKVACYVKWLKELADYQTWLESLHPEADHQSEIIGSEELVKEAQRLFANSLIDEEEFEDFLLRVNLEWAEPRYKLVESYEDDEEYFRVEFDRGRFLVLGYALEEFSSRESEATPLQRWALKQFSIWIEAQKQGRRDDLLPWFDTQGERELAGVKLCRSLCLQLYKAYEAREQLFFGWKDLVPAIEYSGAGLFLEGQLYNMGEEIKGSWQRSLGLKEIDSISRQPESDQATGLLLKYFLETRRSIVIELDDLADKEIINMENRIDPASSILESHKYSNLFLKSSDIEMIVRLAEGATDGSVATDIAKEKSLLAKFEQWDKELELYRQEERELQKSREESGKDRQRKEAAERRMTEEDRASQVPSAVDSLKALG